MAEDLLSRHEAAREKAMRDLLNQGLSSGAISGAIGYSGRYGDRDMQAYVSRNCKDFDAKTKSLTTLCRDNNVVVTSGGIAIPERRVVVDPAMLESNEAHRRGLIAELQRHEQECNTLSRDGLDYCGRTGDRDIDAFCRGACKDIKSRVATLVAFAKGHGVTDFPLRSSDDAESGGGIPTKAALPFGSAGSASTAPSSASGAFGFDAADSSKDTIKGAPPAFGGFGASPSLGGGFGASGPASLPSTTFGSSAPTNKSSVAGFGGTGVSSDLPCSDLTAPAGNAFGATAAPGTGKGFGFLGKEAADKAPPKDTPADTTKVPTSFGAPPAPSTSTGFGVPATKGGFGFLGKDGEKGKDAPTDPSLVSFGAPPVVPASTTTGFGTQPTSGAPAGGFSFLGKDAKDTKAPTDTEKPGATTFGAGAKPAPASGAVAGGFGAPIGPSSFGAGPTAGSVSFGAPKVAPSASPTATATTAAPSNPYQASAATPPADSARSSAFGGLKPSTGPGPFGAAPTTAPTTAAKPDASFGSSSAPFGSSAAAASTKSPKATDVAEALTRDEKLRQSMVDDLRAKGLSDGEITQFGLNYSGKNGPRDAKSFIEGRCEGMTQRAASFAKFYATEMQPAAKSSSGGTSDDAVLNQLVKSQDARQLAVAALCRTGATLSAISREGLLYSGKNGSRDTDKFISGGCQDLRARCGALVQYCNTMGVDLAQGKKKDDAFSAPPTVNAAPVKSVFESGQGFGGGATGAAKIPVAEAAPAPAVKIPRATASPKPTVAPKKSTPPPAPEPPKKQVPVWW